MFEARGWHQLERELTTQSSSQSLRFSYKSQDSLTFTTEIHFSETVIATPKGIRAQFDLEPKAKHNFSVAVQTHNPLETGSIEPVSYEAWRKQFSLKLDNPFYQKALDRAVDDLRALLLFDEQGTLYAAGIPWFVTAFGRDSLLSSCMTLPYAPEAAKGNLRYLAHYQAKETDAFRNAQPGKILHEMRFGELTRTGKTPHSPYYGTVDATPLFIILLHELYSVTGDLAFLKEMQPHWEAALKWMQTYGDLDGDGFLEFEGAKEGQALSVQSWKDSGDSLSHADGTLAQGAIAVSEVQGYAYAAYRVAAEFYEALAETEKANEWLGKATALKEKFHETFWLDDLKTYALALDGEKRPLRVQNSDAGHLLWSGIVPEAVAPELVNTLMSETNWSGWGIRTLGKDELRYNPVSYHNGSVWPHDTALIAAGMLRYGFEDEARTIARALFDLAVSQADLRPPELVGGYTRSSAPPVPYPVACRPQAWDAAALVYLSKLL